MSILPEESPTSYTSGPWSEFAESGEYWINQTDSEGCPVDGGYVCDSTDITSSNTQLIIAAPDLLNACQQLDYFGDALIAREFDVSSAIVRELVLQARAAIAKAVRDG